MTPDPTTDLVINRVIKAPPAKVYRAWSRADFMQKWFAPEPVALTIHKHEFFAGGGIGFTMRLPDGTEISGEQCFLELVPDRRIVMTDALVGGWRPSEESLFTAIVTLEEHADGTNYTAVAMHRNGAERERHADMGFHDGWGTVVDQLGRFAAEL